MHAAEVQWREIFVAAQHIQRHMLTNELRFRVNVYELGCVFIAMRACVGPGGGGRPRGHSMKGCVGVSFAGISTDPI